MVAEIERSNFIKELFTAKSEPGFYPLISACADKSHKSVQAIFDAVGKYVIEGQKI